MGGTQHAWVESPLQFLGVLEHAALPPRDLSASSMPIQSIVVHPRAGDAQLESTAAALHHDLERSGWLPHVEVSLERRVIPAGRFVEDGSWILGDPFSGQVQARLARAVPGELVLVDDGAITRHLADLLVAGKPLLRPGAGRGRSPFTPLRRSLAEGASRVLRHAATQGRLEVTTYLAQDDPAVQQLRSIGARVRSHRFDVTRAHGRAARAVPEGAIVVLGTAAVADGTATAAEHLDWVAAIARRQPVAYAPHRREPAWMLRALSRLARVTLLSAPVPIELALAATRRPLTVVSRPSTALETLELVLRGSGSTIEFVPASEVLA